MGCEQEHILPAHTIAARNERGFLFLHHLAAPVQSLRWFQSWKPTNSIEINAVDERIVGIYIEELKWDLIQLREREDELSWDVDPSHCYTPKGGYLKLSADGLHRDPNWWWKKLWKVKSPPKT